MRKHGRFLRMEEMKIIALWKVDWRSVRQMLKEYATNGEECKPMKFFGDVNTELFAITSRGEIVGVIRLTRKLWRQCHGNVGISIRPSRRGEGFGSKAIREMDYGNGWQPKACIERNNEMSIRAFEGAGWKKTGEMYGWPGGRIAIEYVLE